MRTNSSRLVPRSRYCISIYSFTHRNHPICPLYHHHRSLGVFLPRLSPLSLPSSPLTHSLTHLSPLSVASSRTPKHVAAPQPCPRPPLPPLQQRSPPPHVQLPSTYGKRRPRTPKAAVGSTVPSPAASRRATTTRWARRPAGRRRSINPSAASGNGWSNVWKTSTTRMNSRRASGPPCKSRYGGELFTLRILLVVASRGSLGGARDVYRA